jgi:hypothetical protein
MNEKIQTIHCYVIQAKSNNSFVDKWSDDDYFHWDQRTDEELKKAAFAKKKELEETYIDEKFRVILREEFEQIIEE